MRVRTEAKRDAILDAAAAVFLDLGYARASMSDIAERAGASKVTVYGYFSTKEELFLRVIGHKMGTVGAALDALALRIDEDAAIVIGDFGRQYLASTQSAEARALKRVIHSYLEQDESTARAFWEGGVQRMFDLVERYLSEATASGHLAVNEPKVAAKQLLSLLEAEFNWTPPSRTASASPKAIDRAAARAADTFVAAYRPTRATRGRK